MRDLLLRKKNEQLKNFFYNKNVKKSALDAVRFFVYLHAFDGGSQL